MNYLAILKSGNEAVKLAEYFERQGIILDVVSTPCKIAREGCGYSLLFPSDMLQDIINAAKAKNLTIVEIYSQKPGPLSNTYEKIR
jgi:hypothetical protein